MRFDSIIALELNQVKKAVSRGRNTDLYVYSA